MTLSTYFLSVFWTILTDGRDGKKKPGWIKRAALCLVQLRVPQLRLKEQRSWGYHASETKIDPLQPRPAQPRPRCAGRMRHLGQVKMERSGSKNRSSFLFHISTHSSPARVFTPFTRVHVPPQYWNKTMKRRERSERNLTFTSEEDIWTNGSSAWTHKSQCWLMFLPHCYAAADVFWVVARALLQYVVARVFWLVSKALLLCSGC